MKNNTEKFNFWTDLAVKWEAKRYDGIFSSFIYSSLSNRRDTVAYVLNRLPAGSRFIELGCGSGRIYEKLNNKNNIFYVGYDISPQAINKAVATWNEGEHVKWICADAASSDKKIEADVLVSAGLLDWLSDEQIKKITSNVKCRYFIHSFSQNEKNIKTQMHNIFSILQTKFNKINYSPRKFSTEQILNFFSEYQNVKISTDKMLSFGAFVHNLPADLEPDFSALKAQKYFENKKPRGSVLEQLFKKRESARIANKFNELVDKDVLEIGSGQGHYTRIIAQQNVRSITAVDPSCVTPKPKDASSYEFILNSFENAKLNKKFDVIICFGVLEFVGKIEEFLSALGRVSKDGSRLYLLHPNKSSSYRFFYNMFHKLQGRSLCFYTQEEIQEKLKPLNYRLVSSSAAGEMNTMLVFEKKDVS